MVTLGSGSELELPSVNSFEKFMRDDDVNMSAMLPSNDAYIHNNLTKDGETESVTNNNHYKG